MKPWLLAAALFACSSPATSPAQTVEAESPRYAIAIHGGAGGWENLSPEKRAEMLASLEKALGAGRDILAKGGSSLDAVEQAVRILEDAPNFNAGRGATFTATGQHQLDASIMNGADLSAGAVAGVMTVKNPISLARRVMTDTKHVLLARDGADSFAKEVGVELVSPDYFWTDDTRREFEKAKAEAEATKKATEDGKKTSAVQRPDHYGTVGCVALDTHGNLAAATSTGGLSMKKFGRVGDSPIIGAGTYADNKTCAISGTGVGELFIRNAVCYDVAARMRYAGATLAEAAAVQIDERLPKETAGLIAVNAAGDIVADFNTAAMPRGMADSSGRFEVAIEPDPTSTP
ncbi:MAG: beta-aspartyl-peptidase [Pirellula sp.]|nr:beta-aspartyl-peptidase [Pirellula sp.]